MSKTFPKPVIYHIPVCPFSQRIELYHDYVLGKGNGALPEGRSRPRPALARATLATPRHVGGGRLGWRAGPGLMPTEQFLGAHLKNHLNKSRELIYCRGEIARTCGHHL